MPRIPTRLAIAAAVGLAGCNAPRTAGPVPVTATAAARPAATAASHEAVPGSTAAALIARFGEAALDLREGPARKLQFAGPACVLDAYLYAPREGAEPIVTHIDARLPNGGMMDPVSCVAALSVREGGR